MLVKRSFSLLGARSNLFGKAIFSLDKKALPNKHHRSYGLHCFSDVHSLVLHSVFFRENSPTSPLYSLSSSWGLLYSKKPGSLPRDVGWISVHKDCSLPGLRGAH